jgi:hypothetical protein
MTNEICSGPDLNRHLSRRTVKRPVGASVVELNVPYHSGSPDSFRIPDFGSYTLAEVTIPVPDPLGIHSGRSPGSNTTIEVLLLNESR